MPLRVVVIDSPRLAQSIKRAWKAEGGEGLEIRTLSQREATSAKRLPTDVIIYPTGAIGVLARAGHLQPLPDVPAEDAEQSTLSPNTEGSWGPEQYARSFGSPIPQLVFRRDILETIGADPPKTWEEYRNLAEKMREHARRDGASVPRHVVLEPLAGQEAAVTLLARAAAYLRHPNQYSGLFDYISLEPRIASPPVARALGELSDLAMESESTEEWGQVSSLKAILAVLSGDCWMAISWSGHAAALELGDKEAKIANVGFCQLPGAQQVYHPESSSWESLDAPRHVPLLGVSGRLGSVASLSFDRARSYDLIKFLTSPRQANSVSIPSPATAPHWPAQLARTANWLPAGLDASAAALYGESLTGSRNVADVLICLRIPGRDAYLDALADAVRKTLAGAEISIALEEVARAWAETSDDQGLSGQKNAYRSSLGLPP